LCANTQPAPNKTKKKNPRDSLDHAPSEQNIGSHMGFDATRKLPGENYSRRWPELLKMTDEVRALVTELQRRADSTTDQNSKSQAPISK
jgi:4-hydroxy-3-polyprenylbenzoate decarboxylase